MKASKILLIALCLLPLSAFADGGYYVGGGFGLSKFEDNIPGSETEPPVPNEISDSEFGYKIFAGYKFNKNWSTELGYIDFGSAKGAYKSLDFEMEATGLYLQGMYHWTFSKTWMLDLYLGLNRAEGKSNIGSGICALPSPPSFCNNKDSVWGFSVGIGPRWEPTEHFGTRLQFEYTSLKFDDNTGLSSEEQFEIKYRIGLDAYYKF